MGKNNYIARRDADRKGYFRAGEQTGRQVVLDMMVLALRDPEIMGKDTFGKDRLLKVVKGIEHYMDVFDQAFQATDETDYWRAKLDAALEDAFGEGMHDTFHARYQYCKEFNYKTGRWEK
jgi:hypothetical protein